VHRIETEGAISLAVMCWPQNDLVCDRKTSEFASALPGISGSTDCGFDVMVRQARDRQFEYLNAQQGALEDESGNEFWSNRHRGHDLVPPVWKWRWLCYISKSESIMRVDSMRPIMLIEPLRKVWSELTI
jgi:hypothetical protein